MKEKMNAESLGDRIKSYEASDTGRKLSAELPTVIRIDGRAFHTFARGLARPYDERLSNMMIDLTKMLVDETGAKIGYTQSDEISLILKQDDSKSELFFNGKVFKMTSAIASFASVKFNKMLPSRLPEKEHFEPTFDCRIFQVPSEDEAVAALTWRELDAVKNSVSAAARAHFSHNELNGKHTSDMLEMLASKNVNWNDYPTFFKRGTYLRRRTEMSVFSSDEIDKLPEKHLAHRIPTLTFERKVIKPVDIPDITRVMNMTDVIFRGADPKLSF